LPHVVQAIAAAGHEIASHGMEHQRVDHMNAAQFLVDARTSKALLEEVSGQVVVGYRAPNYSMGRDNLWAHGVLAEAGYRYSSSIYPIRHDHYGMAESPVTPWHPHPQGVVEIPVAALPWWGVRVPVGGGGYFRFYPYFISRWLLQRFNQQHGSAVFFIHPWELDATQPVVMDLPWRSRFRHYLNLQRTQDRLKHLLDDFHWTSIQQLHGHRWQVKR
ncbi:MAG: DUF3473 domain-containing protein, partial [Magnetococcales bacterium]|nr:DUF3473 domain-containing protein [Magnetococcales bacterium]